MNAVSLNGGKPKPPTPPKPAHCSSVNALKRIIDAKYSSKLYDANLAANGCADDVAPLIDLETSFSPSKLAPAAKPPLLPKPLLLPPPSSRRRAGNRYVDEFECLAAERTRGRNAGQCAPVVRTETTSYMRQLEESNIDFSSHCAAVDESTLSCNSTSSSNSAVSSTSATCRSVHANISTIYAEDADMYKDSMFNSDQEFLLAEFFSHVLPPPPPPPSSVKKRPTKDEMKRDENDLNFWKRPSNSSSSNSSLTSCEESPVRQKPESETNVVPAPRKMDSAGDEDSNSSTSMEHSYFRRRLSTWFGSLGKGGSAKDKEKRDSVFYAEETARPKSTGAWDLCPSLADGEGPSAVFTTAVREELDEETKKITNEQKALLVVKELISSEKVFIDVLQLLTEDLATFVRQADRENPVIPEAELAKITNYLPQLMSFNKELLKDFEARLENWSTYPKISDIIIKKGPFLKLFSTYIQHFEKQCNHLDDCVNKYHRFAKAVKDFESTERCKMLTLKHYMLKPVQRLPQYGLLLKDYLSKLSPDSVDFADTEKALQIVNDVADHANKSVEQDEQLNKLLEIQDQFGNYEIIKPGRRLIKAGGLNKLSRKDMQLRYFILLSDCLLYTHYHGALFNATVKSKLSLTKMKIHVPKIEDYNYEFSIISTTRSFRLRARSQDERQEWVKALEDTIKEHNAKQLSFCTNIPHLTKVLDIGKEAPVWVPDDRVTMCQACTAKFKVTFRRHHCRACGKVVCGYCSDNKAPLEYNRFEAARVCDDCFRYLFMQFKGKPSEIVNIIKSSYNTTDSDALEIYKNIMATFKKHDSNGAKVYQKKEQTWLKEVTANDAGSQISGWLHKRIRKTWKRYWFVLKERVLYVYKASEDVKALETIPVLGYVIETFKAASNTYEDIDAKLVFQLAHAGQPPVVFHADGEAEADRWISALQEAVSLL